MAAIERARLKAVARELAHDMIVASLKSFGLGEQMIASCLASVDADDEEIEQAARDVTERDIRIVAMFMNQIADGIIKRGPLARRDRWEERRRGKARR